MIAFVVVFVIVAIVLAIAAGGVTLAILGAAAAIALLIVGVVALVIGVVMAVIHRLQQLWNAPYPWWQKLLMLATGYVTVVIIGDVLGVTPILEGIFGHDAITFEELSTEERWARATTGVLNIIMLLILHRVAKGSGGRAPEVRPPEVRPPELPRDPADPADPVDPARPRDPVRPAYDPSTRTIEQLRGDAADPVRPGETEADATARRNAATDELFRRADTTLPEEPRQVDARTEGHTMERHAADLPFRRGAGRTIEGRIYGDPPWPRPENFSFQWISDAVMNRVVNQIIRENWAQMRTELVVEGRSARTVDTGNLTGRGFVNDGAGGFGPRNAVEARTSRATVVLEFVPGPPPGFRIVTAFPDGSVPLQ